MISLLTGLFAPDEGDAFIRGHSIKSEMSHIRALIGVCPQTNVCWDLLTVQDHLDLYAVIRGLDAAVSNHEIAQVEKYRG